MNAHYCATDLIQSYKMNYQRKKNLDHLFGKYPQDTPLFDFRKFFFKYVRQSI